MIDARKIKAFQTQLNELQTDADLLRRELAGKQRDYQAKLKLIESLRAEISTLNNNQKLKVSEHAIVRYFERIKGFDISEIEKQLMCEEVARLVEVLGGSGTYPCGEFSVVVKNHTITTVVKN